MEAEWDFPFPAVLVQLFGLQQSSSASVGSRLNEPDSKGKHVEFIWIEPNSWGVKPDFYNMLMMLQNKSDTTF